VQFYVDENQDPEFMEDEGIYDALKLDETDGYGIGGDEDESENRSNDPVTPPRKSETDSVTPNLTQKRGSRSEKDDEPATPPRKSTVSEKSYLKSALKQSKPLNATTKSTSNSNVSISEPAAPPPPAPLTHQYAKAAAVNTPKFIVDTVKASPKPPMAPVVVPATIPSEPVLPPIPKVVNLPKSASPVKHESIKVPPTPTAASTAPAPIAAPESADEVAEIPQLIPEEAIVYSESMSDLVATFQKAKEQCSPF
jgi:CCR4-NOT transcription complex subunit 3